VKSKAILFLVLLSLALPGASRVKAGVLTVVAATVASPTLTLAIDCSARDMAGGYTFEILPQASDTQKDGTVLQTFLCNYTVHAHLQGTGGAEQLSGLAITIDYRCPDQTQQTWTSVTGSPRSNEVSRTSTSLLLRDTGTVQGFAGQFTVQEKLFLLLDSHTMATIVVLTDPDPSNSSQTVFSASKAQAIATDLANKHASLAVDPVCGAPPGAASSASGGPAGSINLGDTPWEHIDSGVAVAIAAGAGVIAALAGGLMSGAITIPGTASAGSTGPLSTASSQLASAAPVSGVAAIPAQPIPTSTVAPTAGAEAVPPAAPPPPPVHATASPQPAPVPTVEPPSSPPLVPAAPAVDTALAAGGVASGVAAVAAAVTESATTAQTDNAGTKTTGNDSDSKEPEADKPCPEVHASLFGLPSINSRSDCPGTRPGMGPWYSGIDFTSNDQFGLPAKLDFEALVSGEVTYTGGSFNMVEVKQENGNRIQFLHASEIYVMAGQHVEPITRLGKTGGTGPEGPDQYEVHLHVQAIDKHGNLIDPDCAFASKENRELRVGDSNSPFRERLKHEEAQKQVEAEHEVIPDVEVPPEISIPAPSLEEPQVEEIESSEPHLREVVSPAEASPPHIEATPDAARASRPVYCMNCGQQNPPHARFCSKCGTPIVRV
jgi:hypothetical protein